MTFAERMVLLEEQSDQCQASRKDFEQRMRRVERAVWGAAGALAALQLALKYVL